MNFEVKAISSSTSSFEIPYSIFIISFSFFPKHGLGKNVGTYKIVAANLLTMMNM